MIDDDFFCTFTPCCDDRGRQLRHGEVDAVLHLHLRDVGIGVEREIDRHRQLAGRRAGRRHVQHVVDAVDLLLDRRGDRVGERLRVGARIRGRHRHLHRRDGRVLRDRQLRHRHHAGQADDQRDDRREDRPLDEEPGEHAAPARGYCTTIRSTRRASSSLPLPVTLDRRHELDALGLDAQRDELVAHGGGALLRQLDVGRRVARACRRSR